MENPITITEREFWEVLSTSTNLEFVTWSKGAYPDGTLDMLLQALMSTNKFDAPKEAFLYLSRFSQMKAISQKVNFRDIENAPPNRKLLRLLAEIITGKIEEVTARDRSRYYGVISHIVISELLLGHIIKLEAVSRKKTNGFYTQEKMFEDEGLEVSEMFRLGKSPKTRLETVRFIEKIKEEWLLVHKEMMRHGKYQLESVHYKLLRRKLGILLGDNVGRVIHYGIFQDENLSFTTLMSWVGALLYYKEIGAMTFFRELFLLQYHANLGLGRLDALWVEKIDGENPTPNDLKKISSLTEKKFASVGHVIKALLHVFERKHLSLVISDWKFAAGDSTKYKPGELNNIDKGDVLDEPLIKHVHQIERYITASYLSYGLVSQKNHVIENPWENPSFSIRGELVYFLPDSMPIKHLISLSTKEIEKVFNVQIASRLSRAKTHSGVRKTQHAIVKHTLHVMEKGMPVEMNKQLQLDEILHEANSNSENNVLQMIEKLRPPAVFIDSLKTIQLIDTRKGPMNFMHLDRVITGMKDGEIRFDTWKDGVGGKLLCWMHGEKTGSLSVDIPGNRFKCFGCGVGGKFAEHSIPDDLRMVVDLSTKGMSRNMENFVIPDRHAEIMLVAQEILQNNFLDTLGAKYLRDDRKLNPEISMTLGAGYADEFLPFQLLERGFTYDELVYYGFLGISPNVRPDSPFIQALEHWGLSMSEIEKPVIASNILKQVIGLPYSILNGRVTYPLEMDGKINSFYGRSIDLNCKKKFRHTKLRTKLNNMPHGAFNLYNAKLMSTGLLGITEAPIDADTFYQKSDLKAFCGIVGVDNPLLFELISKFHGNIVFGFDHDPKKPGETTGETGQRMTVKALNKLKANKFKGNIYDFTKEFIYHHPDSEYKDANRYWQDNEKRLPVNFVLLNAKPL